MLLRHLNGNMMSYNRAIWFLMDPAERRMQLEAAFGSDTRVLQGIDDKPLAVSGNAVIFPYDGPVPDGTEAPAEDPKEPLESIVTLPTRGLFAEAQLGHCNACEKRDVTRMWDWTVMTAEEPPEITGVKPGPSGQMPNLTPTPLPSNVIQIAQPPAAPDPKGLADALAVLKTPEIFRDMSGLDEASKVLGKLIDGTNQTLSEMVKGAAQAKEKVDQARGTQSAQSAPSSASNTPTSSSGPSAADLADRFSLVPEIKNFAKEFGLSDLETKELALDQINGRKGSEKPSGGTKAGQPPKSIFEIVFRAFIPSPAIPAVSPTAVLLGPVLGGSVSIGFIGDNRTSSYAASTYRAEIVARVTTDATRGPVIGTPRMQFGPSAQWDGDQIEYKTGFPWWWYDILPGETTTKRHTLTRTPANLNAEVTRDPDDPDLVHIRLVIEASVAAEDPILAAIAPTISADLLLSVWERADHTPQFSLTGTHDGFPAFELFINGKSFHSYDPRNVAGLGPAALFGLTDRQFVSKRNEVIPGVVPGR
jgi:hypothetical protein